MNAPLTLREEPSLLHSPRISEPHFGILAAGESVESVMGPAETVNIEDSPSACVSPPDEISDSETMSVKYRGWTLEIEATPVQSDRVQHLLQAQQRVVLYEQATIELRLHETVLYLDLLQHQVNLAARKSHHIEQEISRAQAVVSAQSLSREMAGPCASGHTNCGYCGTQVKL
ncbi:hypothetical protein MIND_01123800 [Mycena indigotica]|uniref:Uncharacterized protein n=1 Tax=Mycena indigotica TaxID=2126181 RepID=A0A8H6VVI6_9AGAR|nr:uncharacterized protein MIND_01123800 [Mycena indigotica]KAF7293461.1 hypothetical protein MIND_01123800 [Mycena indigotica]